MTTPSQMIYDFKVLFGCICAALLLHSCGTGPWFVKRKIYKLYQEAVCHTAADSKCNIRTDGCYIQTGELHKGVTNARSALIFYANGYVAHFNMKDEEGNRKPLEEEYLNIKTLHWYKSTSDSVTIEFFGNTNVDMSTSVYYKRGVIINDSTLQLRFDGMPERMYTYKFVKLKVPQIANTAQYLKKRWYGKRLHATRK